MVVLSFFLHACAQLIFNAAPCNMHAFSPIYLMLNLVCCVKMLGLIDWLIVQPYQFWEHSIAPLTSISLFGMDGKLTNGNHPEDPT